MNKLVKQMGYLDYGVWLFSILIRNSTKDGQVWVYSSEGIVI